MGLYFDVLWQVHVVIIWKILSELTYTLCGAQLDIIEIHEVAVGLICHLLTSWLLQFVIIYHSRLLHTKKNTHVVPYCDFLVTTFDIWCCSHLHFIRNKSQIKWSSELFTFFPSISENSEAYTVFLPNPSEEAHSLLPIPSTGHPLHGYFLKFAFLFPDQSTCLPHLFWLFILFILIISFLAFLTYTICLLPSVPHSNHHLSPGSNLINKLIFKTFPVIVICTK